jgi:UDP-3-O-[3-hydroxymyristoyl] N-acetylglucosamine deacetylase
MDGLPHRFALDIDTAGSLPVQTGAQRTLKAAIGCIGRGLHTGRKVQMTLAPAPAGTGIVFRRTDLPGDAVDIPARFDHVMDTRLCTVLGIPHDPQVRVGTVEHVMAAIAGCGVSNAVVNVDGPEVPALDGSAASVVFLIDCAGVVEQDTPAPVIEILRHVRVEQGEGFAALRPSPIGLDFVVSIDFAAAAIGRQALSMRLSPPAFRAELARARTFALASDVATLRAAGLALGGNLDNAVVVDGAEVLNPSGLRMRDEFVRHKMLDAVGDLALAGAALRGRYVSHRAGHTLNNRLLRAVFADDANWRLVPGVREVAWQGELTAKAA